jgi:hypothetical protein
MQRVSIRLCHLEKPLQDNYCCNALKSYIRLNQIIKLNLFAEFQAHLFGCDR